MSSDGIRSDLIVQIKHSSVKLKICDAFKPSVKLLMISLRVFCLIVFVYGTIEPIVAFKGLVVHFLMKMLEDLLKVRFYYCFLMLFYFNIDTHLINISRSEEYLEIARR